MSIIQYIKEIPASLFQELILARDGPTFPQVRNRILQGRHAIVPALKKISKLSTAIDRSNNNLIEIGIITEHGHQIVPVANWSLAFVAKEILYAGDVAFEEAVSDGLLAFYSNWYTNIRDPRSLIAAFSRAKARRRAQSILIRMDYEQIALQGLSPIAEIARALILYEEPLYDGSGNLLYDPQAQFLGITNLTPLDFISIGFCAQARIEQHENPGFTLSNLIPKPNPSGSLTPEKVEQFLSKVACNYSEFRLAVDEAEGLLPRFEKYALNPLYRTPIIFSHEKNAAGESVLLAPIPSMLLYRVTHGIYWDLLSKWSEDVSNLGRSQAPDFPSFFGQAFERYVGNLLSEILPPGSLHPQQRYGPRARSRDSCDWIATEGDTAILIECKTSRFHLATKATGDPEQFLQESEGIYGKALAQILQTKEAIQNGQIQLPRPPTDFAGLIVIFDHLLMASIHLNDDLTSIVPTIDPDLTPEDVRELEFRIIPIRMLERAMPMVQSNGLKSAFDASSWSSLPRGSRILPDFLKDKFGEFEKHVRKSFS